MRGVMTTERGQHLLLPCTSASRQPGGNRSPSRHCSSSNNSNINRNNKSNNNSNNKSSINNRRSCWSGGTPLLDALSAAPSVSGSSEAIRCLSQPLSVLGVRQRNRMADEGESKLLDEGILLLVLQQENWNPFLLCALGRVCKKLYSLVRRLFWKEFCLSRAPKMVSDLVSAARNGNVEGGWDAMAKLMFFCGGGCNGNAEGRGKTIVGHYVRRSRFSRTSGRSFLSPRGRKEDVLYMTDPCEHEGEADHLDIGLFRGVFKGFSRSRTRRILIKREAKLDEDVICPFCKARVWSMATARMIPGSAARRLGAYDHNTVEYYVCLHGHVHGHCALLPLSDSDD